MSLSDVLCRHGDLHGGDGQLAEPAPGGGSFLIEKYTEQVALMAVRDGYELVDADTREELARLAAERR